VELLNGSASQPIYPFSTGRPREQVFQTAGTSLITPASRYDYWVETQIRHITMDRANAQQRRYFRVQVTSLANNAMELHYRESDAFSASRTLRDTRNDPSEELALLLVLEGSLQVGFGNRQTLSVGPGEFFLYDSERPQRLSLSRNRLIQFDLCRHQLDAICGGRIPHPSLTSLALRHSGLTPVLRLQISQFPMAYRHMTPQEQAVMHASTESLALSVISTAIQPDHRADASGQRLAQAARQYIHANLDKPELNAGDIARQLGCSRATLYRAFNATGAPVAAYIREQRLQKLYQLLAQPLEQRPITVLAPLCGLYDTPNVGQLFRKRFGIPPSRLRLDETNPTVA